jgi:hypothetical protein
MTSPSASSEYLPREAQSMTFIDAAAGVSSAVVIAGVGAGLAYYFDRRKAAAERIYHDKKEHYRTLILCLKSLREGGSQHVDALWFEYSFMWLHAPDSVILAFNALVERLNVGAANRDELAPLVGNLLLQVRRDMGFGGTNLQSSDFHGRLE